jgi:hypothetical protein
MTDTATLDQDEDTDEIVDAYRMPPPSLELLRLYRERAKQDDQLQPLPIWDADPATIQTVLDTLETSVENRTLASQLPKEQSRQDRLETLAKWHKPLRGSLHQTRIQNCSSRWSMWCVDGIYEVHPERCHQLDCPICLEIRRRTWYHRMKRSLQLWTAPKHVTLTLRSTTYPLDQQLALLIHHFRRLRQRKLWKSRTPWGFWTVEITYSDKTGLFHPHIHVICNMRFMDKDILHATWEQITGDSHQTGIEEIKGDLAGHFAHYVTKAASIWSAPVDPDILLQQLRGKRLVQKFGRWPINDRPQPRICMYMGTVRSIIIRAARGSAEYEHRLRWLIREHPDLVAQEIRRLHCMPARGSPQPTPDPGNSELCTQIDQVNATELRPDNPQKHPKNHLL